MLTLTRKLCRRDELAERCARLPRPLVLSNGVFDILHRGHVIYLDGARALGNSLVVAINSDASARLLDKGPDRPLNSAEDRAVVLAALASVSLVTFFDEPTPMALLQEIQPDFYVKGGDYDMATLPETQALRAWGGQAIAMPFVPGYSSTALIQRSRRFVGSAPS